MASKIARAIGEMNADLEDLIEANTDLFAEHYDRAMTQPKSRDRALWEAAEADASLTIEDFSSVPISQRDDGWTSSLAAFCAAAQAQAIIDSGIMRQLIELAEKSGESVNSVARKSGTAALIEAVGELPGSGITEQVRAERRVNAEG